MLRRRNGRPFAGLGKAVHLKDKPPKVGEQFRTRIADSWDGIRFEIGRMCEMVQYGRGDRTVIEQAGMNLSTIEDDEARRNFTEMARAQFHWVRGVFQYVPDSYQMEKLGTANYQIRQTRIPKEFIMAATAPIYASRNNRDLAEVSFSDLPEMPVKVSGDCDDASVLLASLVAACGIRTRFMLGRVGDGEGYHHVWVQADVYNDGTDASYEAGSMEDRKSVV